VPLRHDVKALGRTPATSDDFLHAPIRPSTGRPTVAEAEAHQEPCARRSSVTTRRS
jgi:hypothetical protein